MRRPRDDRNGMASEPVLRRIDIRLAPDHKAGRRTEGDIREIEDGAAVRGYRDSGDRRVGVLGLEGADEIVEGTRLDCAANGELGADRAREIDIEAGKVTVGI